MKISALDVSVSHPGAEHAYADKGWIPHKPETWGAHFADAVEDISARTWNGYGRKPEFNEFKIPKGTRVKIVMVSRFGDVGITTDLNAKHGYMARVPLSQLTNMEMNK